MKETTEITRWNPFQEFEDLQDRFRSLFLRTGNGNGNKGELAEIGELADWSPAVDVTEDDKEYLITADLPEVDKKDIKVTAEDGRLTISGERKREKEEKKKTWHRVERSYGKYVRSFRLPDEVEAGKVDASFKNGVLTVHLPKSPEKAKAKKANEIPVK